MRANLRVLFATDDGCVSGIETAAAGLTAASITCTLAHDEFAKLSAIYGLVKKASLCGGLDVGLSVLQQALDICTIANGTLAGGPKCKSFGDGPFKAISTLVEIGCELYDPEPASKLDLADKLMEQACELLETGAKHYEEAAKECGGGNCNILGACAASAAQCMPSGFPPKVFIGTT